MPQIEIRPATELHKKILAKIDHSYHTSFVWQMEHLIEEGQITVSFNRIRLPRPIKVEYPHALLFLKTTNLENSIILVALLNEKPVGYIGINNIAVPFNAWITDLVVNEELRRQGIASGLILAAQDWASQQNIRRIIIEMQSKNYPAIQLAQKLGYEFCGFNDHYFANHDIALFFTRFLR